MTKNVYLILKALFVFKMFKVLSWLFDDIRKRLYKKAKVDLKIYDVYSWEPNNRNANITQYLKKQRTSGNEIWSGNII